MLQIAVLCVWDREEESGVGCCRTGVPGAACLFRAVSRVE